MICAPSKDSDKPAYEICCLFKDALGPWLPINGPVKTDHSKISNFTYFILYLGLCISKDYLIKSSI